MRAVLVAPPLAASAARESVHRIDRRVFIHDVDHLTQNPIHGLKRSVLIALNRAHHAPVILLREKALGHANEQVDIQRDGAQQDQSA